jgi:pimeloyl-ACP methyl ester carboxylesterase
MWHRLVPELESRYRVLRYDGRGIGRSDVPDGPYPIARMAADAVAVLDAAGVERAHVFGISLGGIVAQEVALSHHDRVRSLLLAATHTGGEDTIWPDAEVMQMLTSRGELTPEESVRASIPVAYRLAPEDWIEEDVRLRLELPTTRTGYEGQLMGGLGYEGTRKRLANLRVPLLVVTGDADQMVPPANSEIIARSTPGARTVVIPGAGHVLFTEAPSALAAAMLEFLDAVPA